MRSTRQSPAEQLAPLLNGSVKLPPLPASAPELLGLLRQSVDSINVAQVGALIERDPALAVMVLKVANSPAYAGAHSITRVGQAIMAVGLEETLQLLNFQLLRNTFPTPARIDGFSMEPFWKHAWATAMAARMLGQPQMLVGALPGELYMAGLLHDMGKMILALHLPGEFEQCLSEAAAADRPLAEVECERLGVDHAQLGGRLLTAWRLPALLIEAIAAHHAPQQAPAEARELATLLELANGLAHEAMFGISGNPRPKLREDCIMSWRGDHPLRYQGALMDEIVATLQSRLAPEDLMQNEPPKRPGIDTEPDPETAVRRQPAAVGDDATGVAPPAAPKRSWWSRLFGN